MKSRQEYIEILQRYAVTLRNEYGVKSMRLFGSIARDQQTSTSDIDLCVDMAPKLFLIINLKRYLESILGISVDVVRLHKNINPLLKSEIERDGIYIFQ